MIRYNYCIAQLCGRGQYWQNLMNPLQLANISPTVKLETLVLLNFGKTWFKEFWWKKHWRNVSKSAYFYIVHLFFLVGLLWKVKVWRFDPDLKFLIKVSGFTVSIISIRSPKSNLLNFEWPHGKLPAFECLLYIQLSQKFRPTTKKDSRYIATELKLPDVNDDLLLKVAVSGFSNLFIMATWRFRLPVLHLDHLPHNLIQLHSSPLIARVVNPCILLTL